MYLLKMILLIMYILYYITVVYAQSSDFIRDYFVYKKVSRVVGFSCGDIEDDIHVMRLLNIAGISVAIKPAKFSVDIQRYLKTDRTLGVFLDMRCPNLNINAIFDESSANRMYDYSYNWLILGMNISHTLQNINDSVFSIITDFVISLPDGSDYLLYDVYNQCKLRGGILNITQLGTWRENNGLTIIISDPKIVRRRNYHSMRIKAVGIVLHRPAEKTLIEYLEGDTHEIMDNWPKFGYTVLSHVSDIYNFTMDPIEINYWEKNDSNGPMIGSLKKGDADLGYYPSILTTERYSYARPIIQQWPTRTCFLFRTIPMMKMKPWVILKPFAADTWYMLIVIIIITIVILSLILRLEHNDERDCSIPALITVATLCQQGVPPSFIDQLASRIAFIQIAVFGLLMYNYYSAAIVSARLNEPLHKMNDSLRTLAHSKMSFGAEQNVFFNFLLRNPRPEVQFFKNYWNAIPESQRFFSIEDGVNKVMQENFAFHADPDDVYPLIEQVFDKEMICQLTEVHLLQPSDLGLWSNLNSHFHEIVKIGLIKVSTAGLRRREIRRRSARRPYCPTDEIFVSSLTIYEAAPILIFLLLGMLFSLILFGIEKLTFYATVSKQVTKNVMPREKNKTSLKNKVPPKDNITITLTLPHAKRLFRNVLIQGSNFQGL